MPPLVLSIDEIACRLNDPKVQSLAQRTTCVVDPEIDAGLTSEYCAARVTLKLIDGCTKEEKVMFPKGSSKRPMNMEEVCTRFRVIVSPVVGTSTVDEWLKMAEDIDNLFSAADLMKIMRQK